MSAVNNNKKKNPRVIAVLGACLNTVGVWILCDAMRTGSLFWRTSFKRFIRPFGLKAA